jgi:hypothetical protein
VILVGSMESGSRFLSGAWWSGSLAGVGDEVIGEHLYRGKLYTLCAW